MKKVESLNADKFKKLNDDQLNQLSGGWVVIWVTVDANHKTKVGLQGGLFNLNDARFMVADD